MNWRLKNLPQADPPKKLGLDVLIGPRLKLRRARTHIDRLAEMARSLPSDLYSFEVRPHQSAKLVVRLEHWLMYEPKRPVDVEFSLVIGDAAHNLRAALDHLASGIIRHEDPQSKPFFPIPGPVMDRKKSKTIAAMEKALPGLGPLLLAAFGDSTRPANPLWAFADLDNDDKHNLILPTVVAAEISGISFEAGGNTVTNMTTGFNANAAVTIIRSAAPITFKGTPKLSVEVQLGRQTPFPDADAIQVLRSSANPVEGIIASVELLLNHQAASSETPTKGTGPIDQHR